ncbi:MAG: 4-(cytidine 5'-diphospho)-2-C-methyl-D-erythritol kinase, partial [Hyphomicrobiales bacterium]|nr:4-(cytidine 5'-diphospho)-2-C-methyl-D-erythritol kinase [Hyphomicrobiales bacterium]
MRWLRAPAKVNLTLAVHGRREDGLHEIESLVAFAGICDWLGYDPGETLALDVDGRTAGEAGPLDDNLVLVAARALKRRAPEIRLGRFRLIKRLPAAAGLGGGSSDAAAALRALAEANGLSPDEERVRAAALETGADVPVCLCPRARVMRGVGEKLSPPVALPSVFALLVNPRVQAPTRLVFAALGLKPGERLDAEVPPIAFDADAPLSLETLARALKRRAPEIRLGRFRLIKRLPAAA